MHYFGVDDKIRAGNILQTGGKGMLKKIMFLCLSLFFLMGVASAQQFSEGKSTRNVLQTTGKIKQLNEIGVNLLGEGDFKEVVLKLDDKTYIVDGISGKLVTEKNLKKGLAITGYYSPMTTRSIPPQSKAFAVVIGDTNDRAIYLQVEQVLKVPNGVRVLCTNGDRLVTITSDVLVNAKNIKVGDELLVWYRMMTMSLPGQATATKAVKLNTQANCSIKLHELPGVIAVNGQEIQLTTGEFLKQGQTRLVPLRAVAEKLGYKVEWVAETQLVKLHKGWQTVALKAEVTDYQLNNQMLKLDAAPQFNNGKILVPMEFFSEVLAYTTEILSTHI